MLKFHLILFLILGICYQAVTQINNSANCKKAYVEIMSLKFEEAEKYIEIERNTFPENIYISYLENYIDFLKVFISEDEEIFEIAENNKSQRLKLAESLPVTSPYRNYLLANINLQWAIARIKFNEYFSAAIEINRAYHLIEENNELFPDFYPNKITHGILKIMIGLVPDKYDWVLNIISLDGSVENGTDELYEVLQISKLILTMPI